MGPGLASRPRRVVEVLPPGAPPGVNEVAGAQAALVPGRQKGLGDAVTVLQCRPRDHGEGDERQHRPEPLRHPRDREETVNRFGGRVIPEVLQDQCRGAGRVRREQRQGGLGIRDVDERFAGLDVNLGAVVPRGLDTGGVVGFWFRPGLGQVPHRLPVEAAIRVEPFRPGVAQPEQFERAGHVAVDEQPPDGTVQVRTIVLGCRAEPEHAGAGFVVAPAGEHPGQADLDAADGQVEIGDIPWGAGAVETGQGHGDVSGHQLHPGLPEPADPLPEDLPGDAEPLVGGDGQQAGQFTEQSEDVAGPLRGEEGQGTARRGGGPDALAGDDGAITQAHDQPG